MPDARIEPDGTLRIGADYADPYANFGASAVLLPRIEVHGGVSIIKHIPGFANNKVFSDFGDFKDKSTGLKALLLQESDHLPAVALGVEDPIGTGLFRSQFLAASKRFGPLDATVGVGRKRIDGVFGGARYRLPVEGNWSLVLERDANNYAKDFSALETGVAGKGKRNTSYAVEYKWGWLEAQLSSQRGGTHGFAFHVAIPLNEKEYIPKFQEPAPYSEIRPRPTAEQWNSDSSHRRRMVEALLKQDFKDVRIRFTETYRLEAVFTNTRISKMSRAVGRAARTILLLAPVETREIAITYTVNDMPVATYAFVDPDKLQRYFNGMLSRKDLVNYVSIAYAEPGSDKGGEDLTALAEGMEEQAGMHVRYSGETGDIISLQKEDFSLNRINLRPLVTTFLNGPQAFQYSVLAAATYDKKLAHGTFLHLQATYPLLDTISSGGVVKSDSLLPHVRSDFGDYRAVRRFKLEQAFISQYFQPAERIYGRVSAGLYEETFGGLGGQIYYYPRNVSWSADLSVDAVKKRNTVGWFGFRDYENVQALASVHYRLPYNATATVRAGRFLARDNGVRVEFKRRFRSGVELGGWYSYTDAKDLTGPALNEGGGPYRDKGIFASIPFDIMLPKDTAARGNLSLSPWARDVGQMVRSPGDLHDILEQPLVINMHDRDGLVQFGDYDDDYDMPATPSLVDRPHLDVLRRELDASYGTITDSDTWRAVGLGLGMTALSSVFDRPADRWAARHEGARPVRAVKGIGNALPLVALGAAGFFALDTANNRLSEAGTTAVKAGVAAGALSVVGKYLTGRSRPEVGAGNHDFHFLRKGNSNTSFPSGHASVIWGTITPFAKEYEMPALYGLAAVTNVARVVGRRHWVSDTVGGALLGYGVGTMLWEANRNPDRGDPKVMLSADGVTLKWETK